MDVIALRDPGNSTVLSRAKRKELAMVLHHACLIKKEKISILSGIEEMVGSLRNRIVSEGIEDLKLPIVLPTEIVKAVKE